MNHIHDVNEYERIPHTQVSNVNFFLINLTYRPPHMHHDFEIVQVIEGGLHVKTLTEEFDLGPGEIALFNPDVFHTLHSRQSDCILLTIQADPSFCAAHYPAIQNIRFNTSNVTSITPFAEALDIIHTCFNLGYNYCFRAPGFELRCVSDLYRLFSYFTAFVPYHMLKDTEIVNARNKDRRLTRIITYIHQHYRGKITLSELAEKEGLSITYLSHFFKDAMKMSFQEYVNSLRFEHAVLLLKKTDMNITDICLESGFSDSKYLNKRFQQAYHMTLKEFRKKTALMMPIEEYSQDEEMEQYIYTPQQGLQIMRKHHYFDCDHLKV